MGEAREPEPSRETAATLHDLTRSLIELQGPNPGLSVDESSCIMETGEVIEPEKGLSATYRSPSGDAEVQLLISDRRAKLVTRTVNRPGVWSELEDRLIVTMGDRLSLLGRRFDSVDELASALVSVARRRAEDAVLAPMAFDRPAVEAGVVTTTRGPRRRRRVTTALPPRAGRVR